MVYDGFQAKDLAEACAEFTLWHHEAFSKRQLGGIRLSLGTGEGRGPRPLRVSPVSQPGADGVLCPQGAATGCRWAGWTRRPRSRACGGSCCSSPGAGWKRCSPCGPTWSPGRSPQGAAGTVGSERCRPGASLCGLGSVPSPSSSNEVTPEGTSGSFLLLWAHLMAVYCTGHCTLTSPSAVGLELLHPTAPSVGLCPPSPPFQPRGCSGLVPALGGVGVTALPGCPFSDWDAAPWAVLSHWDTPTGSLALVTGSPPWSHWGPSTNTLWAGTAKSPKDFL